MDTTGKECREETNVMTISVNKFIADFGQSKYLLDFTYGSQLTITVLQGAGRNQTIGYKRTLIRSGIYMVTWQETDRSTVTHIEDFGNGVVYTNTTLPDMTFLNNKGSLKPAGPSEATLTSASGETMGKNNMDIVTEFLELAFNRNDVEGAAKLVTERYIQHNPFVADGRKGFVEGITGFHKTHPGISWNLKHIYADDDFVIDHSLHRKDQSYSTVDIFHLQGGKIDEHWDVSQRIPPLEEAANQNTMF